MSRDAMHCVVCNGPVDAAAARYPNAWEAARKRFPCCSEACKAGFDADQHWIPGSAPPPASEAEVAKLLRVTADRLAAGDAPTVVVREMLQAGVPVPGLRKVCNHALMIGTRARRDAASLSAWGALFGFLAVTRDKRRPPSIEQALTELDRWEAHAQAHW